METADKAQAVVKPLVMTGLKCKLQNPTRHIWIAQDGSEWLVKMSRLVDRKERDVYITKFRISDESMVALVSMFCDLRARKS